MPRAIRSAVASCGSPLIFPVRPSASPRRRSVGSCDVDRAKSIRRRHCARNAHLRRFAFVRRRSARLESIRVRRLGKSRRHARGDGSTEIRHVDQPGRTKAAAGGALARRAVVRPQRRSRQCRQRPRARRELGPRPHRPRRLHRMAGRRSAGRRNSSIPADSHSPARASPAASISPTPPSTSR